jgi:hypothetical protein
MLETLLVFGLIGLLVALGSLAALASLKVVFVLGLVCIGLGMGVGMPAGAYYRVKLYQLLRPKGSLDSRFWLQPTRFHSLLDASEWRRVAPWFYLGGAGFGLIVLGCVIVLIAVWKA